MKNQILVDNSSSQKKQYEKSPAKWREPYYLLPVVKGKSHEPDLTFLVVKLVDDGDIGVIVLQLSLVEKARLPAYYGILTTLDKDNLVRTEKN